MAALRKNIAVRDILEFILVLTTKNNQLLLVELGHALLVYLTEHDWVYCEVDLPLLPCFTH